MIDDSFFDDIPEEELEGVTHERFIKRQKNLARSRRRRKQADIDNEVGFCKEPTLDMLEERKFYAGDFVEAHKNLFPESTGLRPFGSHQINSIRMGQDVFTYGGRLLKLEPRGYTKTTRICNESLVAVLEGIQRYIVIICSNQEKATQILDSIKTEIYTNEGLYRLYPATIACFRKLDDNPLKCNYQTYGGSKTYIKWSTKVIQFPIIPGEPSSGAIIEIRPLKNVKGLQHKIEFGELAGKVQRPTLYVFDDPQTHEQAKSEPEVRKIVNAIKRDALKGGSHSKRASAIMSITPVAHGDAAWYFLKEERSWEYTRYKMMEKEPTNKDWWFDTYAKTYLDYDRTKRGDRIRAALEARKLVEENWQYAHEGAEMSWEHAYGWDEEPQIEVSALQHAINIILDDGIVDFEYECQCNVEYGEYDEGETINCPSHEIARKLIRIPRCVVKQDTSNICAHIDVNKNILTYTVVSTPKVFEGLIPDYGTYPQQPTPNFTKRRVTKPLSVMYPNLQDYREVLYKAVLHLIEFLATRKFKRQDGIEQRIGKIGIDLRYEERYVTKAIQESIFRNIIVPCMGVYVGPDDELLHEKGGSSITHICENCYEKPSKSGALSVFHYDTNYFKTEVHRAFNQIGGTRGSLDLYGVNRQEDEVPEDYHYPLGQHCNTETPSREVGAKTGKTKIKWTSMDNQPDNEYFDNLTGCLAILGREGVTHQLDFSQHHAGSESDMQEFMNSQGGEQLL